MRVLRSLAVLASGCVVYLVIAACSSLPLIGSDDDDGPGPRGANGKGPPGTPS